MRGAEDEACDGITRDGKRQHGNGDTRGAGTIEGVDLYGQHVEHVRQRQPDRSDLRVFRRQAVEDATCDHEMRLGIVVAERQPAKVIQHRRCGTNEEAQRGHSFGEAISHVAD
jgi:hypothetical protein